MAVENVTTVQAEPNTTGRTVYFDVLRVLAAVAVMAIHVVAYKFSEVATTTFAWNMLNLTDVAATCAVPVFFMLSGALLLSREYSLKKLYGKKILRIVTCFVFWSAIYALWEFYKHRLIKDAASEFLRGPDHMWFLFTIVGLYMFVPVFKRIVEDEKTTRYCLLLLFIFSVVIDGSLNILSAVSMSKATFILSVFKQSGLHGIPASAFYFILGYYLSTHTLTKKQRRWIYIGAVIGFLFGAAGGAALSMYYHKPTAVFLKNNTIGICLEAVGVFVFIKQVFSTRQLSQKAQRVLAHLAKDSFGAYLVHYLVIMMLEEFLNLHVLRFHTVLSIPLLTAIVALISFGISDLLNRIPVVKKFLV